MSLQLHFVTDDRLPFDRTRDVVSAAVDAGVDVVQLRVKGGTARDLLAQTVALSDVVAGRALFVVDDRVDIVLAARDAGARVDGVHLGQSDLPPQAARRLLGDDAYVGWTANTPAHLAAAAAFPAGTLDYLGVGVIRPTSTKPDHPPALGVDGFGRLAAAAALPCVAIGGIGIDDIAPLRDAGAAGVAVVSLLSAAEDPAATARELRRAADATTAGVVR
ncbi:thiamine phosphate synthase [Microbacterium sp. NPDC058389]|uniref:thiamine phosphate synthase n=1 Tax=Microbacterium sp. NPDC058389 TaxID=3346475 RepID=UPI0036527FAC